MDLKEKKIFFVISPHINYYHSYRGDSRGRDGFGTDISMMEAILDKLDEIEDKRFSFGDMRVTWDYADTFWSIQLQQEYQQDVLDRVIERCKKGMKISQEISSEILKNRKTLNIKNLKYGLYKDDSNNELYLEAILSKELFDKENFYIFNLLLEDSDKIIENCKGENNSHYKL